jgi:hypothetical protein
LHDLQNLDRRGIPGCGVATEAFRPAADAQMKALGFAAALVWVPHPIQNRTSDELAAIADSALERILALIQRQKGS